MTMNDDQAAESAAPGQEGLLDPRPMVSAECVPRHGKGCLRINRRIDAAVHENHIAEPQVRFQMVQSLHCSVRDPSANQASRQCCIRLAGFSLEFMDESITVDAHPFRPGGFSKIHAADG